MWREQIPLLKQAKHVTAFEFDKKLYETVLTRVDTLYVAFSAEVVVYCVCVCARVRGCLVVSPDKHTTLNAAGLQASSRV